MGKVNKEKTQKTKKSVKQNTGKNTGGTTGRGFDVCGQPDSESKKKGWERKRQAKRMMDKLIEYMSMSLKDFEALLKKIKKNPSKFTVEDALLYKYASKAFNGEKFMLDWFDRNVPKAPSNIATEDDKPIQIQITRSISNMGNPFKDGA